MSASELHFRVRRLQILFWITLGLAIVPWVALGAAAWYWTQGRIDFPGVVTARSFEVLSEVGTPLARLTSERGSGVVAVHSKAGRELAQLGISPHGGGALQVRNGDAREVVWLGSEPIGSGNLSLRTKEGEILVVARDNDGHGGGIAAYGAGEKLLAFLGAGLRGDGALQTCTAGGATVAELCTNQYGEPLLQLHAKAGHVAFTTGVGENGEADVTLFGPGSKAGATLVADPQGGRLGLFDAKGQQRLRAGYMTNGNTSLKIIDAEGSVAAVIGQANNGLGGFVKALSRGEHEAFYAGVNDREGCGLVTIFHPSGQQVFAAGMSGDGKGGIINVHDLDGKMILRTPESDPR
jgi:hypothetical protein